MNPILKFQFKDPIYNMKNIYILNMSIYYSENISFLLFIKRNSTVRCIVYLLIYLLGFIFFLIYLL